MKKRKQAYNNPEYKQIKDHLPEILEEMEKDKDLKEFQIPEEWDNDFERIYQKQRRKERIRTRILTGVCCAVILGIGIVHIGEHMEGFTIVQADDIEKVKETKIEKHNYQYNLNGNVNVEEDLMEDEEEHIFQSEKVNDLYGEIQNDIKIPFLKLKLSENVCVEEARYNKEYRILNWRFRDENKNIIYVSQQKAVDAVGNGSMNDVSALENVYIKALDMKAIIYQSTQDDSFKCSIVYDNVALVIISNMESIEFKKIVENIYY